MKRMPSMLQAGDYSAADQYLTAVKAAGTDDADAVMAQLKKQKINDMFAKGGYIRPDGRMVHEMYLMQVKTPAESKEPWDYFKVAQTIPGEQAYQSLARSACTKCYAEVALTTLSDPPGRVTRSAAPAFFDSPYDRTLRHSAARAAEPAAARAGQRLVLRDPVARVWR